MRIYRDTTADYELAQLRALGYSGSINDMQFAALRAEGLTGSLTDMFGQFGGTLGGGGATASSTDNPNAAITFTFAAASPVIQYADEVWAVAGATVTGISPASAQLSGVNSDSGTYTSIWRHGTMSSAVALGNQGGTGANPALTLQGWDQHEADSPTTTEIEYSDALNVDPGRTGLPLSGVQILAKGRSNLTPANDARDNLTDLGLLYMVSTLPPAGSFRMWNPADAPVFNVSDMDLTGFPLVALPSGATLPTIAAIKATLGPLNLFMRQNLFMRGVNALNQQTQYGGDIAADIAQALHFAMCSASAPADRDWVWRQLVAHGILIAYAQESGCRWSSATFSFGGGHHWLKTLVVIAARVMRNASNVTARNILAKWADFAQSPVMPDDLMITAVDREDIESLGVGTINTRPAPVGYMNFMENTLDWNSKPSGDQGSYMFQMAYREINGSPWMSLALAVRMIGAQATWNNAAFFEYVDRYYHWWVARGKPANAYLRAFSLRFIEDYFETYSPAYQGATAPSRVRLVVRDTQAWIECGENLDLTSIPGPSAFTLLKNGSPVTLVENVTTGSGTLSSGSINVQNPIIRPVSLTGAAVGKRIMCPSMPVDTLITSLVAPDVGVSSLVAAGFAGQPLTISPIAVYGRSCAIIMDTPAVPGDVFTLAYTAPGSGFLRNVRGVALPSFTAQAMTNTTGQLPAAAGAREVCYSGPVQADRQYLATAQPASETIKRLQISLRFWLESKNVNDTILGSSTGATTNFRLFFATVADLRILIAGQQFRMPGSGTALPLNTEITAHFLFDYTATTYPTINRGVFRWNGSEHVASTTGSTGALDGLLAPDIATIFGTVPTSGIGFGASGNGNTAMDGGISQLAMRWGGAGLSQPADFSAAPFAWNGDWGGNAENLHGVAPQRFYNLTVADANSKVINRGSGGAAAMTPRRLDATGDDLLTYYVLAS